MLPLRYQRRRVLIEVGPSWSERARLLIYKLSHPRHRWLDGTWLRRRGLDDAPAAANSSLAGGASQDC